MELYLKNWYKKLLDELLNTRELKIISPFVKEQVIRKIESQFNFENFELITRFNLQDFAMKVSSLSGLKFCVEKGASVFGIKDLHSKVYIFDKRAAIITSANMTNGGLVSNYECGIFITDKSVIQNLHNYFNDLKKIASNKLTIVNCDVWETKLVGIEVCKGKATSLSDYGATLTSFDKTKNYYIKFFGKSDNRVELNFPITTEIDGALCHYACGFPLKKRPQQVKEGDIIFMARMTKNPNDYAIFGKAIALKYTEGRDIASKQEIAERSWKQQWPIYLRVKNPIFINGIMADGILLSDLLSKFDYNSFPSTRKRYDDGEIDIKPTKSLMRKAYVKLTHNSAEWLDQKLDEALNNAGQVDDEFLKRLPQTTTNISLWTK
ncbi:phospholipase D family protein [Labilibaculum euxinus]